MINFLKNIQKSYKTLFFNFFTTNYWRKLAQNNLRMTLVSTLALASCALSIFFLLKSNIFSNVVLVNNNANNFLQNNFILSAVFAGSSLLFSFIWLKIRWKSKEYYEQFNKENQKFILKNPNKILFLPKKAKNILKKYTFLANYRILKLQFLLFLGTFLYIILEQEYKRINTPKAETIKQAIAKKVKNTQNLLENVAKNQKETLEKLKNTKVNINVLEKTLKNSQQSFQEQQGNIWQNYAFLGALNKTQQQINNVISVNEKENILKNDPVIFAQVRGLVEVELDMAEKNTSQASEMLNQEGNILAKFQKFSSYQHNCQYKAQKGVQLDQKRIKELQELLKNQKNIFCHLQNQQKEDSIRILAYQNDIKNLK